MTGASNFVLYDQAGATSDSDTESWYLTPKSSDAMARIVFDRSEAPRLSTLDGLSRAGAYDYALVDADAADWTVLSQGGAASTRVLYEAPTFAGFDWRALALRGKVGEFIRTRPSVRVVEFSGRDPV